MIKPLPAAAPLILKRKAVEQEESIYSVPPLLLPKSDDFICYCGALCLYPQQCPSSSFRLPRKCYCAVKPFYREGWNERKYEEERDKITQDKQYPWTRESRWRELDRQALNWTCKEMEADRSWHNHDNMYRWERNLAFGPRKYASSKGNVYPPDLTRREAVKAAERIERHLQGDYSGGESD